MKHFSNLRTKIAAEDSSIIHVLSEAIRLNTSKIYILESNEEITISYETAKQLASVHDQLNYENQLRMRYLLSQNAKTFKLIEDFCRKNSED
jgi:hypothetical protein